MDIKRYCRYILLLASLTTWVVEAEGQSSPLGRITGYMVDHDGNEVPGASLELIGSKTYKLIANQDGTFAFDNLVLGTYSLQATHIGYQPYSRTVDLVSNALTLSIVLTPRSSELESVTVTGKTETQQVREQAIRAVVVDTREVAEQPVTLAELMNRSSGVRIRQSGGLGNDIDVSINGFQGNSVQYFRDGIPLEYLGGGYGLNNVPVNLLERAEVYKGVVPVSLGGDALGGAVNLIQRKHIGTMLDISYEAASFNTHIANLSVFHNDSKNRWFVGIDGFYNYSDNDYLADVEIVNEQSNLVSVTVPLFHNGYKHYFAEAYGGVRNRVWADELKVSIARYGIDRQSQHPALMTNPYGALTIHSQGWVPSLRYKKQLGDKLAIDQFISYSAVNRSRVDTVRGTYDWYGNFTPREGIGESPRRSLSDINFDGIISRTYLTYPFTDSHKLEANIVYNRSKRLGEDPYGFRFAGTDIDVLSKEAIYAKTIAGISWESKWFDDKLTNQLTGKFFHFNTRGINGFMANATSLDDYTTSLNRNWGFGNAIKYTLSDRHLLRASLELTNRLPLANELFGDNDTRAPNFDLEPERSFNINMGYRYQAPRLTLEMSAFYRKTKGMILLVPVQPPFAQYQNLDSVRGYGFDIDVAYQILPQLRATANATWQDNRMIDIGDGLHKWIEGTRLRNTPYFFANASLMGNFKSVLAQNDAVKPYLHWNFIREFYLNHIPRNQEPGGFLGLAGSAGVPVTSIVPNQNLLSAGLTYFPTLQSLSVGFEIKNITNARLYDYYKIQRPGRSFHVKINYNLTHRK